MTIILNRHIQRHKAVVIKASFSVSRLPNDSTLNYRSDAKSSNARKRSAVASLINRAEENSPQSGYVQDFQDNLRQAHQQVRQAMGTSAVAEKTYFDRRVRSYSFAVGQRVWLYWPRPLVRQKHRKLTLLWTGPLIITSFRSPILVELKDITSGRKQIVHIDRIRNRD